MIRMLLVAPDTNLSWSAEVELLGQSIHAVPLTGNVSSERLTRATQGERFTILHVAAHGDDNGVWLSDDEQLTKEELAQIARHVRADLVFLNACRSAGLGQYLACQGVPAVVAYTMPTLDRNALRTASYYYEELVALGMDYHRAFEKVGPCDGSLAWFAGAGYVERAVEPLVASVVGMQDELKGMRQTVLTGLVIILLINLILAAFLWVNVAQGQTVPVVSPLSPLPGRETLAQPLGPLSPMPLPTELPLLVETPVSGGVPTVTVMVESTSTATPTAVPSATATTGLLPVPTLPPCALPD
jgi:hypothetical protein